MGINLSKLRNENQRLKHSGNGGGGGFLDNFVKMPEGDGYITVRILPPAEGKEDFFAVSRTHRLGSRGSPKSFHCLCTLVGEKWQGSCPVCDFYRYLWQQSDVTTDLQEKNKLIADARAVKPIDRYYYNVVVRQPGQPSLGPKILSIGKKLHEKIISEMCGDANIPGDEGYGDVTDLQAGRDLLIKKELTKGSDMSYPDYTGSKFMKPSVAGSAAEVEKWMASLHDLAALRQVKTAEELRREIRIFRGLERDPNLGFDPADFGAQPARSSAPVSSVEPSRKAPQPVVEDDPDTGLVEAGWLEDLKNI